MNEVPEGGDCVTDLPPVRFVRRGPYKPTVGLIDDVEELAAHGVRGEYLAERTGRTQTSPAAKKAAG